MPLDLIISMAKERGLDGVCITDHHSIAGSTRIKEGVQENGVCVIFGMEYSTQEGDFLVFGPFKQIPSGLNALELLTFVRKEKGVAIGAHPFRANRRLDVKLLQNGYLKLAEGINGRNRDEENLMALNTLPKYSAILLGGSDAHTQEEIGRIRTRIPFKIENRDQFLQAAKALEKGLLKADIITHFAK